MSALFFLAGGLTAISFIFPESWLARFVPFFWMVPLVLALGVCVEPTLSGVRRALTIAIVVLAFGNAGLALVGNITRAALGNWRMADRMREFGRQPREILIVPLADRSFEVTAAYRLEQRGIRYRIIAPEECTTLIKDDRIQYCLGPSAEPHS